MTHLCTTKSVKPIWGWGGPYNYVAIELEDCSVSTCIGVCVRLRLQIHSLGRYLISPRKTIVKGRER